MRPHRTSRIAALAATTLALACAPALKPGAHRVEHLASPQRCSQGPFEIRVTATGSPHGEDLVLTAFSPRSLLGVYRVLVDGREVATRPFGRAKTVMVESVTPSGPRVVRYEGEVAIVLVNGVEQREAVHRTWVTRYWNVDRPDNQRCVAATGERPVAEAPPQAPPEPRSPARAGRARPRPRPAAEPPPADPPPATAAPVALRTMTAEAARALGIEDHRTVTRTHARIVILDEGFGTNGVQHGTCALGQPNNRFRAGADVRIQLWSAEPNDLEGVVFRLDHRVYRPTVTAEKWKRYVAKQQEKCRRDQAKLDARSRARHEKALARDQRRPARPRGKCRFAVVERSRTGLAFRQWVNREAPCECLGQVRIQDETCWGQGGYIGFLQRLRGERAKAECEIELVPAGTHASEPAWVTRRCACVDTPDDEGCWGQGGLPAAHAAALARLEATRVKREAEERERAAARLKAEPPPPPPPRTEARPPRPSDNAEWVPGYWTHTGVTWAWIAGWYRVPPADVEAGRTVKATRPREAVREAPAAAPVATAVWIPGFWMWNGRAYVWLPGAWRIPPRPGLRWRPSHWRITLGGAVLVPGGWAP